MLKCKFSRKERRQLFVGLPQTIHKTREFPISAVTRMREKEMVQKISVKLQRLWLSGLDLNRFDY